MLWWQWAWLAVLVILALFGAFALVVMTYLGPLLAKGLTVVIAQMFNVDPHKPVEGTK